MKKFDLEKILEGAFDRGHEFLTDLSTRWSAHTNRRTIIIVVAAGALAAYLYLFAVQPPESFPTDQLVSVPQGESLQSVAYILQQDGVIRSPLVFRVLVTFMGNERTVHAGDYLFKQPLDVFSIARAMAIGAYGLEPLRIRIPEGATTRQMAAIFSSQLLRFNPDTFLAEAQPLEGYLFPDTYNFLPNASESDVIEAMRQNFDQRLASVSTQISTSTHSLSDIIIMASIVEREAYNTKDRRLIAGVLYNRLSRGMPLASDVTLQYVIHKPDNQLTMTDLHDPTPYNTHIHVGLPPTPVDSPSLDSILAAANPTKSSYLYFFADKSGVTHYSNTYRQHAWKVSAYLGK